MVNRMHMTYNFNKEVKNKTYIFGSHGKNVLAKPHEAGVGNLH